MSLYVVGQVKAFEPVPQWEFQGVFSTEEKAVAACRNETYFVGPCSLDAEIPHETAAAGWLGAYYPKAQGN